MNALFRTAAAAFVLIAWLGLDGLSQHNESAPDRPALLAKN